LFRAARSISLIWPAVHAQCSIRDSTFWTEHGESLFEKSTRLRGFLRLGIIQEIDEKNSDRLERLVSSWVEPLVGKVGFRRAHINEN
jgi:hypothetical protein